MGSSTGASLFPESELMCTFALLCCQGDLSMFTLLYRIICNNNKNNGYLYQYNLITTDLKTQLKSRGSNKKAFFSFTVTTKSVYTNFLEQTKVKKTTRVYLMGKKNIHNTTN